MTPKHKKLRHRLRNAIAKDVRTPKYKMRVVQDKRRKKKYKVGDIVNYEGHDWMCLK